MKQYFVKRMAFAGLVLLTVPTTLLAQKEKEKSKEKGDLEQIIITRRGVADEKTVIEINGDKIKVNGKNIEDSKEGEVTVLRNKIRDHQALARGRRAPGAQVWNFDMGEDGVSLFREDANRAMLGVITEEDEKGARINSISKESAAEKAGLKAGDVITKIGTEKIEDAGDVSDAVHSRKPGDKVDITILRNGKEQKITAELGKWKGVDVPAIHGRIMAPDVFAPMEPGQPFRGNIYMGGQPRLGLSVQDSEDGKGVKVLSVAEESNAAKAGIQKDDVITHVNDEEVNSADELAREVRDNRENASFKMKLQRNGKSQTVEVRIPRKLKTANL